MYGIKLSKRINVTMTDYLFISEQIPYGWHPCRRKLKDSSPQKSCRPTSKIITISENLKTQKCCSYLDLPVMPHVVTLFADDLYHIFDTLDEQRLPKLKHLKLEKAWHERRDSDSMELCKGHRGVESITMILCCTCDQVPETIVKLFPNVKEFDLTWKLYGTLDFAYLVWFMDPFKFWNLDLAKLSMEGVRLSGNLVAAIGVMSTWKGLKIAKVSAYLTRAGFTNVIEDLIDISADFKTLDIQILSALGQLPLGDEFMEELRSMIAAKGAPMTLRKA